MYDPVPVELNLLCVILADVDNVFVPSELWAMSIVFVNNSLGVLVILCEDVMDALYCVPFIVQ